MRAAPAVSVRCSGGSFWRAVQSVLPALSAGVMVLWAAGLQDGRIAATAWVGAGVLAATLALFGWWRLRAVAACLVWDGQRWTADDVPGTLSVMIDLGPWMLFRLHADRPGLARWLAVSAADAGPAWHALRAAAYASPPSTPGTSGPQAAPAQRTAA